MHRHSAKGAAALFVSFAVSTSACSPYETSSVVVVRDPALVRYTSHGVNVPVSRSEDAEIARHDVVYRGDRFSELVVTAHETPNGSLVTSWSSNPPIWQGERIVGIGNEGVISVPDHVDVPRDEKTDVIVPLCGRYDDLGSRTGRARAGPVTTVSLGVPCEQAHDVAILATTPLSNVRSVKVVADYDPAPRILAVVVAGLLVSGVGVTLFLTHD